MKGVVMSATPAFSPRLIGETEKALNAILDRHLAGSGLTEQHWITLTLVIVRGGSIDRDELVKQVVSGAKFSEDDVRVRVSELVARQLLDDSASPEVTVTDAGAQLHARIRATNDEFTARLWGDLSAEQLATAAHVLETVLERANTELAQA
jgi:DNA-binding MarR family transcriptional regulator